MIVVVLALACLAFMFYPLLSRNDVDLMFLDYVEDEGMRLKQNKANYILILKELDFDYETGKLSKEDYVFLRDKYKKEAADVLKKIDIYEERWAKNLKKVEASVQTYLKDSNA